ncbi:hypothetical protein GQR58_000435 [Nymphon striatum]|nr:hypothetical protein GQR58_000435 [Nymphon striatum]
MDPQVRLWLADRTGSGNGIRPVKPLQNRKISSTRMTVPERWHPIRPNSLLSAKNPAWAAPDRPTAPPFGQNTALGHTLQFANIAGPVIGHQSRDIVIRQFRHRQFVKLAKPLHIVAEQQQYILAAIRQAWQLDHQAYSDGTTNPHGMTFPPPVAKSGPMPR